MATGGTSPEESGLLAGSDKVSGALLSHVSYYIYPETRKNFALSLGLEDPAVSHIEANFPGNSQRVNIEILQAWHNNAVGMNVGIFMDKLGAWQRAGYVNQNVWSSMGSYVPPYLIPVPPTSQAPSGGEEQRVISKRIDLIQKRLKGSLRRRCRHKLSTDWLPSDKAQTFPLRDNFVELKQRKKVKRAVQDTAENIRTVHDILKIEVAEGGVNIALRGEAGIGKSSSMAMLASDWMEGESLFTKVWNFLTCRRSRSRLAQFSFVFLVDLFDVKDNSTLAQVIMKQHDLQNIPESQIRSILEGEHGKVLLLLDGYDEYKEGTNHEIDRAIKSTVGDCFLIVTSREGDYMSKETLAKIDGEIEITGFSEAGIERCAAKYMNSEELAKDFTAKCKEAGIYGLLRVPIILLMTVVLFKESNYLPKSLIEIVLRIVWLMIDRCTQIHFDGKTSEEIIGLKHLLKRLGRLSLEALKNGNTQILKEDVMMISPDLLKLGLLHGTFLDQVRLDGRQPVMMTYPHKLFLEFMAAYFSLDYLKHDIQDFPFNPFDKSMRTVATFVYGLDKHLVVWKVAVFIGVNFQVKRETFGQVRSLLESFSKEDSSEINLLYNMYICSINDYLPRSDVHSILYLFDESLPVQWKEEVGRTTTLPSDTRVRSVVSIRYKTDSCLYKLLVTLAHTGRTIGWLYLYSTGYLHANEAQTKEPLQLQFRDACISLDGCNMRSKLLQDLLRLRHSRNVIFLHFHDPQHFSRTMFCILRQLGQLRALGISDGQYDLELCQELCTLFTKLPNLDCFALSGEPTQVGNQLLSFEERVQIIHTLLSLRKLKRLCLRNINISGVLTEVCRKTGLMSTSLEVLVVNYVQLTEQDVLSLEKLTRENKMPVLLELYSQGNDFRNYKYSLEKLLRTVDHKLPNCRVFVSPDNLSVPLDTNFSCLRVQRGPELLSIGTGLNWMINPS